MPHHDATTVLLAQAEALAESELLATELDVQTRVLKKAAEDDAERLAMLDRQTAALLEMAGLERDELVLDHIDPSLTLSGAELASIGRGLPAFSRVEALGAESWDELVLEASRYLQEREIDQFEDPLEHLLSPGRLVALDRAYHDRFGHIPWTRWDFGAIGMSVTVATLVDFFFVSIPPIVEKTTTGGHRIERKVEFLGNEYRGSPVTAKLRETILETRDPRSTSRFARWAGPKLRELEKSVKVTYDIERNGRGPGEAVAGLRPAIHRLMSPGHDPALGVVWSVIDQVLGGCTLIDRTGKMQFIDNPAERTGNVILAAKKGFLHLLSDVPTPAGVQPPFFTLTQSITKESPFVLGESGERVPYADAARFMYAHGYTLEHFATMSLVPLIVEGFIRAYYAASHFEDLYRADDVAKARHRLKQASMLTAAHSLATCGNLVKTSMMGMNPAALNWAEHLALARSFLALAKAHSRSESAIDDAIMREWVALHETVLQQAPG